MSENFIIQPLPGGHWTFYGLGIEKTWMPDFGPCTRASSVVLYHKPSNNRWQTKAGFSWASDPNDYNWDMQTLGGVALSYLTTQPDYFVGGPALDDEIKSDAQATINTCLGLDAPPFEV